MSDRNKIIPADPGSAPPRRFRPALWSSLLVAALLVAFVSLGNWQMRRAQEKRAILTAFDAGHSMQQPRGEVSEDAARRYPRYTPLAARGRFDGNHQFLLDNVVHDGRVGFYVWTPLLLTGDDRAVLVNRGWLPLGASRDDLPDIDIGADVREIAGMLDRLPEPGMRLGNAGLPSGWPKIVVYPRIGELQAVLDYPLYDYLLLMQDDEEDGFLRDWRPQLLPPRRHVGYAVQWFAFATAVLVLFLLFSFKREN